MSLASAVALQWQGPIVVPMGKDKLCTSSEPKLYTTNQHQILNDWLRRWGEENCQIWLRLVLYGGLLPMWVKCRPTLLLFFLLVSLIRLQTTIRHGFWCTMAQKTSFGIRICPWSKHEVTPWMCLLSIRSVKIERKGVKIPKIWLSRKSPPKRKRPKISYRPNCYLVKYTNGCNETMNLT